MSKKTEQITENIRRGANGAYYWTYEVPMLKNPTILITVYKVLGIAFGIVYLFMLLVNLIQGVTRTLADLWAMTWPYLILVGVFVVLGAVAYLIVAWMYGGKYIANFEMTETYLCHTQIPAQAEKARAVGALTVVVGALAKRPTVSGAGLMSASKTQSTSDFSRVKTVKVRPRRHVIYVNETLEHNQVYAAPEDFEFVSKFICEHCENAKIK